MNTKFFKIFRNVQKDVVKSKYICMCMLCFLTMASLSNADEIKDNLKNKAATTQPKPSFRSYIRPGPNADSPKISLSLAKFDKDGHIWPVFIAEASGFELVRTDQEWACAYSPSASGIILGIGTEQTLRQLKFGEKYQTRGLPLNAEFSVPKTAKDGSTVEVELIIDDDRIVQPSSAKQDAPISISGSISKLATAEDELKVIYHRDQQHLSTIVKDGTFKFDAVGGLGGELAIMAEKNHRTVAYIQQLKSNSIIFPDNADYVFDEHRMNTIKLHYSVDRLPAAASILSFHLSKTAKLPIFWCVLDRTQSFTSLQLSQGTWIVKSVGKSGGDPVFLQSIIVSEGQSEIDIRSE